MLRAMFLGCGVGATGRVGSNCGDQISRFVTPCVTCDMPHEIAQDLRSSTSWPDRASEGVQERVQ
jgi:hypothetical protein